MVKCARTLIFLLLGYGGKMMGILGDGCSCQERGNGEGQKGGLWMW